MTELNEIYKCTVCGNIVEIIHTSAGELVCCGQPMQLQKENSVDASQEKHVPVLEDTGKGLKVTIGSVPHPMEEEHYIEWLEIIADGKAIRKHLKPGNPPETIFYKIADKLTVRAYCNLHGLWKAEL